MRDAREVVKECRDWVSDKRAADVIEADRRSAQLEVLAELERRLMAERTTKATLIQDKEAEFGILWTKHVLAEINGLIISANELASLRSELEKAGG